MLLALDTSTSLASLALAEPDRLLTELTWQVGQRHSTELPQQLEALLARSGATLAGVSGVAVARGPGSFNGVRVALTTAKSLAFALWIPLYGVPTLDSIAWSYRHACGQVWAILEAGRGQVYAARYDTAASAPASWGPVDGYSVLTPGEVAAAAGRTGGQALFAGELRPETRAALAAVLGGRATFTGALETRQAAALAELALARAAEGRADDPAALEPLYLRRPAITTSGKARLRPQEDARHARHEEAPPGGEGAPGAIRG